jgi:hypothetical protein
MKTINQKQAVEAISSLEDFKAGALSGVWVRLSIYTGRLSVTHPEIVALDKAITEGKSVYVVRSYQTPIAYYTEGWHLVTEKFSSTTSRHQSIIRKAVA